MRRPQALLLRGSTETQRAQEGFEMRQTAACDANAANGDVDIHKDLLLPRDADSRAP